MAAHRHVAIVQIGRVVEDCFVPFERRLDQIPVATVVNWFRLVVATECPKGLLRN
ncbi:MAG: hypothetical protein OXN84_17170 [Albidovulum sp.]|nr:hypothetical protein [Albidovulum sp.]